MQIVQQILLMKIMKLKKFLIANDKLPLTSVFNEKSLVMKVPLRKLMIRGSLRSKFKQFEERKQTLLMH